MSINQNPFGTGPFGGNQNPFGGGPNPFRGGPNPFKGFKKKKDGPERYDSDGNKIKKAPPFKLIGAALAALFLLVCGLNSYYVLDEDNYAVVTTFGNPQAVSKAGLHFKAPFIQDVRMVSKTITGMPIGYIPETGQSVDEESVMITKDFNFVNTDFYLEYMVSDPVKYLYASEDPEATLKMLAQSYIRDTVGVYNVDDVITIGKAAIQSEIKEKLTNRVIQEDIGLAVVNITIQDAFPPTSEVLSAFKNVENAKQGKETAINNANKDRNEKIPQAEAECDQIIKIAEAEKQARINEAQGQVSRFEQMYEEYSKYPLITKQRMFYETMEDVLPNLKLYILDDGETQKMLPLDNFFNTAPAAGQANAQNAAAGQTQTWEQQEKAEEYTAEQDSSVGDSAQGGS